MKATATNGRLLNIPDCYITIDGNVIPMRVVPDISDSKSVSYADENGIGRSTSMKNFSYSEVRTISWTAHFVVCHNTDPDIIYRYLRLIESASYPKTGGSSPYSPPPICHLRCGRLLAEFDEVCAVLKSYSVKADSSVPWANDPNNELSYLPYKLSVDMQFDVVYDQSNLPGSERIAIFGL